MGAGEQFLEFFDPPVSPPWGGREAGKLNLPYDVPANQFMNLEGQKISGSRNWASGVGTLLPVTMQTHCAIT